MALKPPKPLTHLAYRLPLTLAMRLEELCAATGDDPADAVADFVELALDDLEDGIAEPAPIDEREAQLGLALAERMSS